MTICYVTIEAAIYLFIIILFFSLCIFFVLERKKYENCYIVFLRNTEIRGKKIKTVYVCTFVDTKSIGIAHTTHLPHSY